jgi:NAD(P)-dependent dehydrogenase (short-subunit alcohol dehydrogenase family)
VSLLRERLLDGQAIAAAGPPREAVSEQLAALGAALHQFDDRRDEPGQEQWARARAPLAGLVFDAAAPFGAGGPERLQSTLQAAWAAIRALGNGALIPGGAGGRIVLVAPSRAAGPHAGAAGAALENLARTLATEWARYQIVTTAIVPGRASGDHDVATLVAYLFSPAGGYFTGCRFDLALVTPQRAQR